MEAIMSRKDKGSKVVLTGEKANNERQSHNGGVITQIVECAGDGKTRIIRHRAAAECVLDAYCLRNCISPTQYQAGLQFRKAYLRAVLHVRVADNGAGSHGDSEMAFLTRIHSEELLKSAYAILSDKQKAIVINVCGHDIWAGGKVNLRTLNRGLRRLAEYWDII
jgi:hypothetical protein